MCPICGVDMHKDDPLTNGMCVACNDDMNYILDVMGDSPEGWVRK